MKYKCLSIAGFDGSGGAGIQADLKAFSALGCYGMTVLTALPVQNTCGVRSCYDISIEAVKAQLEAIFDDIVPDSIKIGMLFSSEIIEIVAAFLEKKAKDIPIVLDPVMMAKSGDALLLPEAIHTLKSRLIPLATIITPNIPEAQALNQETANLETLAKEIFNLGPQAVLLKGGHAEKSNESNDFFFTEQHQVWLKSARVNSKNTHGTGCTLSAAICAFLAKGSSLLESCEKAKKYLYHAMLASKDNSVGRGQGPVHHFYDIW